jgi:hypothetical protein
MSETNDRSGVSSRRDVDALQEMLEISRRLQSAPDPMVQALGTYVGSMSGAVLVHVCGRPA